MVACARGELEALKRLLGGKAPRESTVSRILPADEATARRVTPLEATAFNLAHSLQITAGSRLADIAQQHGHMEILDTLRSWMSAGARRGARSEAGKADASQHGASARTPATADEDDCAELVEINSRFEVFEKVVDVSSDVVA